MSRHQKPSSSYRSDWFQRPSCLMGSFLWDDECNNVCYSQRHNGRPLSVVLTEPFDPFEPQATSFFDDIPYIESDFASLNHHHHQHHHQRSRSSGRRYKRECYNVHYPNVNFHSYCFSPPPPPPPPCRPISRARSREILVEKIETVTIEEQQRRPPAPYMVSFVRTPSPTVRQLKIRARPSSCFDLHKESTDIHQQQKENRWSKVVDEHHEEHFQYSYNYNKTPDRIVPIEREQPPPPPRVILQDATTSTEDLYIPPPPLPPKQVRPETRETGTTTAGLPRRPLCVTGTSTKPCNSFNYYTAADRQREKNRVIVRPTSKPREILVDTSGIFGCPGQFSEPTTPQIIENGSTTKTRSPFQPPDFI
ncbi:unnamed protein product [Rotaria sp. Silwood2]|nr:unnamed protein product [Rotaria sp. Silwood2]CAF2511232.1 unnamed protein product [Rotaria sp. Silwood2]CAF2886718.1 unnamed protein product [Rotaria sp. Silwood2]